VRGCPCHRCALGRTRRGAGLEALAGNGGGSGVGASGFMPAPIGSGQAKAGAALSLTARDWREIRQSDTRSAAAKSISGSVSRSGEPAEEQATWLSLNRWSRMLQQSTFWLAVKLASMMTAARPGAPASHREHAAQVSLDMCGGAFLASAHKRSASSDASSDASVAVGGAHTDKEPSKSSSQLGAAGGAGGASHEAIDRAQVQSAVPDEIGDAGLLP
jgi:hypothetical protein